MSGRFGYGNHRTLGQARFAQHHSSLLEGLDGIRFTSGFKSLESLRHAVFGSRMTLEAMVMRNYQVRSVITVPRAHPERAEKLGRVNAILRAYPDFARRFDRAMLEEKLGKFLVLLRPENRRTLVSHTGDRVFGMAFKNRDESAYVLTYAHRRFYLWKFNGEATCPRSWEASCINTHLFHSAQGRVLIDAAKPRKNSVDLREFRNGLPEHLRNRAEITCCFLGSDFRKLDRDLRTRGRTFLPPATTPTWFIHAFMGHDVRGTVVKIPLVNRGEGRVPHTDRNSIAPCYNPQEPSIILSPESKYIVRMFAQPHVWTRYSPESERASFVYERSNWRTDWETGEARPDPNDHRDGCREFVRANREEMATLFAAHPDPKELAISVNVLARMAAQAGQ